MKRAWLPLAAGLAFSAVAAVAAVAVAPRLFLAWAIPLGAGSPDPSCAPDESHHVPAVRALAAGHPLRFPESGDPHAAYLPTAYAPQAISLAALSKAGADGWEFGRFPVVDARYGGYWLARVGSVVAGVAGVLVLAWAVFAFTGSAAAALLAGLAAALHPQLAFVGSYVNGDVATFLFGALLVLALARWARTGEGDRGLLGVGLGVGCVLLGKPNGYALLVPTAAWLLWAAVHRKASLRRLAAAAALALLLAAPPLAWNASRIGGDPFGSRALTRLVKANPAAALLAGTGLALAGFALRRADGVARRAAAWLVLAYAVNAALLVRMSWWVDYQPQGRYLLLPSVLVVLASVLAPAALRRDGIRWAWPAASVAFLAGATVAACKLVLDFPFGP